MHNQKVIEQLGYTAKEAKVYLTVLRLGECQISDIATKVKMPRSSVHVVADKLFKEGLLNFYSTRRYTYWVAENPERLVTALEKRKETVEKALPNLISLYKTKRGVRYKNGNPQKIVAIFRVIANASSQPILITNSEREIEYVNRAWEEQFGYALSEVQGENARFLKSGKTLSIVYVEMKNALIKKKIFQSNQIVDMRKDGTYFNLLTTILPLEINNNLFYIQILTEKEGGNLVEHIRTQFTGVERRKRDRRMS